MVRDSNTNLYGWYNIPATQSTIADVLILVSPPIGKEGATLTTDVAILDQFGNEHWIKGIEFSHGRRA
jgi:hypothetical protein